MCDIASNAAPLPTKYFSLKPVNQVELSICKSAILQGMPIIFIFFLKQEYKRALSSPIKKGVPEPISSLNLILFFNKHLRSITISTEETFRAFKKPIFIFFLGYCLNSFSIPSILNLYIE